jgi:hypothetical protein
MAIATRSLEVNMYSLSYAVAEVETRCRRERARAARPLQTLPTTRRPAALRMLASVRSPAAAARAALVAQPSRAPIADR